jgi:hypothetical protein
MISPLDKGAKLFAGYRLLGKEVVKYISLKKFKNMEE